MEVPNYQIVTALTAAKCKVCMDVDKEIAYMDIISEWINNPGWKQTLACKRCGREVEQESKVSQFLLMGID